MMKCMPTSVARNMLYIDHLCGDFFKSVFYAIGGLLDCNIAVMTRPTKQKYFLFLEILLNEYWKLLAIVSDRGDYLSFGFWPQVKVERIVAGKRNFKVR